MTFSGGCQCGAVRFRVDGDLGRASICHCRMCQKATGGFFGPYVSVEKQQVTWTRGRPKDFQSSDHIRRGFCPECGTPLTFDGEGSGVALAIGAFDDPRDIRPTLQIGLESRLPYIGELADLPTRSPEDIAKRAARYPAVISRQHPDHDT